MDRTACTGPQSLYSTPIPLLPLWPARPVQSLSACTVDLNLDYLYGPHGLYRTSLPVPYSYTSTPPMDRTACTEPQCLYSTAIPLLPLWVARPVQSLSVCTVPQCVQSLSVCRRVHLTLPYFIKWTYLHQKKNPETLHFRYRLVSLYFPWASLAYVNLMLTTFGVLIFWGVTLRGG